MKKSTFRKGIVVGIIVLFVGAGVIPSTIGTIEKKTVFAGVNSRGGYIQDLIDNASDGDTIYIPSGTYYENIIINKSISLIGEDMNTTIIDGGGSWDVVFISADWVNISGFTIRMGYQGIDLRSNYTTIKSNTIKSINGGGISLYRTKCNTIKYNTIWNNQDVGIWVTYSNDSTIIGNIIGHHYNNGIYIGRSNNNTIIGNTITRNGYWGGYGISISDSSNNTIMSNNISKNFDDGISLYNSENNIISYNSFFNDGLSIRDSMNNIVENNTVNGKPLIYFVDESDIIIDNAGQIILINCDNITVQNQELYNIPIGIDLRNTHNCLIFNNTITSNNNQGIFISDSNSNTITGNTISNNGNWACGGLYLSGSNNVIKDNTIIANEKEGIRISGGYNNTITNNIISNNENGIYSHYGSSNHNIITNNTIFSNKGDGIHIFSSYLSLHNNYTIMGNIIDSNEGTGVYLKDSDFNTIIDNNISNNDGGILLYGSSNNLMRNNVMVNNNCNFLVTSYNFMDYFNDVDDSNTVNGKIVYYWISVYDTSIPLDAGYVLLVSCTNILVENLTLKNSSQGIILADTHKCTIIGNTISGNEFGISLGYNSEDNIILGNTFSNNSGGVNLGGGNNTIKGNVISDNEVGIDLGGDSNTIKGNVISKNKLGVFLGGFSDNFITKNNFLKNKLNIFFSFYKSELPKWRKNRWLLNYWDRPRILPKPMIGIMWVPRSGPPGIPTPPSPCPWFKVDWRPALRPYKI